MALNDLWKKFIRDEDEGADEADSIYRPRKRAEAPSLVDEPDDDMMSPRPARTSRTMSDYDADELGIADPDEDASKPRFKRVMATGIKSAEHAVDLVCRKFVVLVNTEQVEDEALTPVRCYLAGAIHALGAHITPLDDENFFVSIEPFDASPYLPNDEEEVYEEQEEDLI